MKGYNTAEGYMGLVNERYMLFASESEYREYRNVEIEGKRRMNAADLPGKIWNGRSVFLRGF